MKVIWKHYIPAAVLFAMAWVAVTIPALTVFLVAAALVTFGTVYAWVVYKIHQVQKMQNVSPPFAGADFWSSTEPTFRNVTATFVRTRWARDVNS